MPAAGAIGSATPTIRFPLGQRTTPDLTRDGGRGPLRLSQPPFITCFAHKRLSVMGIDKVRVDRPVNKPVEVILFPTVIPFPLQLHIKCRCKTAFASASEMDGEGLRSASASGSISGP